LYKKFYTEEERQQIIADNDHHTDKVSVVAPQGLNDLETVITLTKGVNTTICKLLFFITASGTSTEKLFIQIKRQAIHEGLL
jgi:hypothetical protein